MERSLFSGQKCAVRMLGTLKTEIGGHGARLYLPERPTVVTQPIPHIFSSDNDHVSSNRIIRCARTITPTPPTEASKLFKCEFFYLNFSI